ncbi:amidohydrolase [Cohnella caldifontis]|uniref:amidohydrolase n=1 Tax=Cohnella caldifontis TaxID=3027471 RepID=UPI0023ED3107|nr:amidohydrolase [Cohnella sp. YIM B05605]
MSKRKLAQWVEDHGLVFEELARQIWERPEVAYEERFAAETQKSVLRAAGFRITEAVGGIPTAFIAEAGKGKPVIGIIGEFDALPGLSQQVSAVYLPAAADGPGHGCGHNLLGAAGVEAAIAVGVRLAEEGLSGRIRYYGCPAEEVLSGKTFMAREGVFGDLDAALTWHPGTANLALVGKTSALTSVEFRFAGKPSHAGAAPHLGRSALDAVELMNVGANYLREHVPEGSRIHYVITNGGSVPNIVPEKANVWYFLRGNDRALVDDLQERLIKVAKGAAMMTETEVDWAVKAGAYDFLPNETLIDLLFRQKDDAGIFAFSDEESAWAASLAESLDREALRQAADFYERAGISASGPLPVGFGRWKSSSGLGGSTDLGDVSWIAPVGTISTTCAPIGVQLHTWQATAAFGSSIGLKGMHYAAKLMGLAVYELLTDGGDTLSKAKAEFRTATGGRIYKPAIPPETRPPVRG